MAMKRSLDSKNIIAQLKELFQLMRLIFETESLDQCNPSQEQFQ